VGEDGDLALEDIPIRPFIQVYREEPEPEPKRRLGGGG
jgi:amino acid transporter